jgi:predicted kinase/GNAT superfamily N-acetyltransferase
MEVIMSLKSNFIFRRANLQDEAEIKFLAEIDMTIPAKFDKDFVINEQMTLDRAKFLKSVNDNDFFEVVIDKNENIVGFHVVKKVPHFNKFAGRIDTLWVSPSSQKHGLASDLKKHAEAWAIEHNLGHLHTWVHSDNTKMISINERMGYKIVNYKMRKDKDAFLKYAIANSGESTKTISQSKKIYAIAGQMGSGKTTWARKLAKEKNALFFSTDQWVANLGVPIGSHENYAKYYTGLRDRIFEVAKQALSLEVPVVFDFGVNLPNGRAGLQKFASACGADLEIYHVSVPTEICRERVRERNIKKPEDIFSFTFSDEDFDIISKNYEPPTSDEGLKIIEVKNE